MPIHHAVLALLADGPSYGYELKTSFQKAIGPQWGELNIGHLYQTLERLVRDGLVTGRVVPQNRKPDKTVYRLTKRGRAELDRWVQEPFVRGGGYRDEFFLKLLAASRLGSDTLKQLLAVQRDAYLEELSALGDLKRRRKGDVLVSLLLDAAVFHTEANLRIVDRAERAASELLLEANSATHRDATIEDASGTRAASS